jgi:hypothetical protein
LAGETEVLVENLPQRQFIHHKSHLTRPVLAAMSASIALSVHCVTTSHSIIAVFLHKQDCIAHNFIVLVVRSEDEVQIVREFSAFEEPKAKPCHWILSQLSPFSIITIHYSEADFVTIITTVFFKRSFPIRFSRRKFMSYFVPAFVYVLISA